MRTPLLLLLLAAAPEVLAASLDVQVNPPRVLLGREKQVLLQVRAPPGLGQIRTAVSTGTLGPVAVQAASEGAGEVRTWSWAPPDIRYPQLALLALWVDEPGKPPEVTLVRLPLVGRTDLQLVTEPRASVVVELGGERFGPVRANRRGAVAVPVEVPPGGGTARVLATVRKRKVERTVKIPVPPSQPLVALLSPASLPMKAGGWLRVLAEGGEGPPLAEAQGAALSAVEGEPGLYRVQPAEGATQVTVEVRWKGSSSAVRVSAPVSVETKPPEVAVVSDNPQTGLTEPVEPEIKTPPPPPPPRVPVFSVHVLGGGFFAGGANAGPAAALGAGLELPSLPTWLALEAEVGVRHAWLDADLLSSGRIGSRVWALPVTVGARVAMLEYQTFTLYGRAGVGAMPFNHQVTLDGQQPFQERQIGFMGFAAAQADWKFGPVGALLELRLGYGTAQTQRLDSQLGGLSAGLGLRYTP